MKNKKNSGPVNLLCFILCFAFTFMAASSMVFAKADVKSGKVKKETSNISKAYQGKVDYIQTFILDSMDSKKNKEIAKMLSSCTSINISQTAKKIGDILGGRWGTRMGVTIIKDVLNDYLGFTTKAKQSVTTIIGEGFSGVVIPNILSRNIRAKINMDVTGNSADDRGIKFMVKAIQILQRIASLSDETVVTVTFDSNSRPGIEFNHLESYSYITSSISDVLKVMNYLPFERNFEAFVTYYENYLESCNTFDIVSYVYLLNDNNIPYKIVIK